MNSFDKKQYETCCRLRAIVRTLSVRLFLGTLFTVLCTQTVVFAQQSPGGGSGARTVTVTGKITDLQTGEPIPGATVLLRGSSVGATADGSGTYSLRIPAGQREGELIASFLGYEQQVIPWTNSKTEVDVALKSETIDVEQIVVVGYGAQRKSDVTGAIASVAQDRLANTPSPDVLQLLQGSVAGLTFSSQSAGADPDANTLMLVRGRNSISAEANPLVIVDGQPFYGSLTEISPGDIQSFEVLKDASSAAIYGSRASNGVFLITTKQGQKGRTVVKYDGYYSLQSVANWPKMMTVDQYIAYKNKQSWIDDDLVDATIKLSEAEMDVYKDGSYKSWTWKKLLTRQGNSQLHNLSISGGSDNTKFNISAQMLRTQGIIINDNYTKYTSRMNVTTNVGKWLTYNTTNSLNYTDKSGATPDFSDVLNKSPLMRPFNPDGTINIHPDAGNLNRYNPLECLLYDDLNRTAGINTAHNFTVKIPGFKGFSYKLSLGGSYINAEKNHYYGNNTGKYAVTQGNGSVKTTQSLSTQIENLLTYQRDIGKHTIFITGLAGWEEKTTKSSETKAEGFPTDLLSWYGIKSAGNIIPDFDYSSYDLLSSMLRLNYVYNSRYLITYTIRNDGYSAFGFDKKWGVFQSVALGWNVMNADFFAPLKRTVNNLKLRVSYGDNGNQAIKPYTTISKMANNDYVVDGTTLPGFIPKTIGTDDLSWETTRSLNLGFDFGLFKNRISGDFNVYRNNTFGLLLNRQISPVHGIVDDKFKCFVTQNIGKTRNEGVELALNTRNIQTRNFTWTTNLTGAFIRTKIIDLYGDGSDDIANKWFIGQPIKVNYDYYITGVWQLNEKNLAARYGAEPGYAKYDDRNLNGEYDEDDRQVIGSPEPNFTWGMNNTLTYHNFTLSVFVYGAHGMLKNNTYKDNANYLVYRDIWTPNNPINSYWSYDSNANKYIGSRNISPSSYEKADYIRIKDITLGYTVPERIMSRIGITNLNIYVSGKNLFTFTQWQALDPELDNQRAIPLQREFLFGLKVAF